MPGGTGGSYRMFGYKRRARGYVSRWCTEFETVGDRVRGYFFRLKLGADLPANVNPLALKLRDGAEPVRMSAPKYVQSQLKAMRDTICEQDELKLVYKNSGAEWESLQLIPIVMRC
jgi:hypothetical protein